jgi:hypothetical protein
MSQVDPRNGRINPYLPVRPARSLVTPADWFSLVDGLLKPTWMRWEPGEGKNGRIHVEPVAGFSPTVTSEPGPRLGPWGQEEDAVVVRMVDARALRALRVLVVRGCGVVLVERIVPHVADWANTAPDERIWMAPEDPRTSVTPTEPEHLADSDVAHPAHYTRGKVECIDAIESAVQGLDPVSAVLVGQVLKYVWRHAHKGTPMKDLEKAAWYLERLTRHVTAKETK